MFNEAVDLLCSCLSQQNAHVISDAGSNITENFHNFQRALVRDSRQPAFGVLPALCLQYVLHS